MSWITWVDDDKASANCTSLLLAESEHSSGFQAGGPAKSKNVNAALRQANLIGCALMDIADPTGNLSGLSARSTVKTKLQNYFNTYATKASLENGSIVPKNSTNATNATYAQYADTDTSKGTIEERLTNLGFKQLQAYTTRSINVSGATYNGSIGTVSLNAGGSTYRQGNMSRISLTVAFTPQSLSISKSNQFYEFYFNSAEATVSGIIPENYLPTFNHIFTVYGRINVELRSGSDTLVTRIQDTIPIKCTVKTSGDITLQIYTPLTASNGSGVIDDSHTRREILGQSQIVYVGYPVDPYV